MKRPAPYQVARPRLQATHSDCRSLRSFWVYFAKGQTGAQVFGNQINHQIIDEWIDSAGITDAVVHWSAVEFTNEGDATLCLLRFR